MLIFHDITSRGGPRGCAKSKKLFSKEQICAKLIFAGLLFVPTILAVVTKIIAERGAPFKLYCTMKRADALRRAPALLLLPRSGLVLWMI
jgi:hypothetical protein